VYPYFRVGMYELGDRELSAYAAELLESLVRASSAAPASP
jgi:hypothetical protein